MSLTEVILKQTNLAKRHGIYGFAIFYYYNNNKYNEIYDIFLYNINFNFLFIWENNNNNVLEKFDYLNIFIDNIKKYLLSKYYIKINGKQVLSINKPTSFSNLNELLLILREKFKNNGIEIYILCPLTHIYNEKIYINIFDGYFDLLNFDLYNYVYSGRRIIYYQGLIYKNLYINKKSYSSTIYRSSIIKIDNKSKKNLLKYYTPEKFYHLNRIIINWTIKHYKETNGIIFINSWNNYKEGNYLEPDEKYGSTNINCFSKALFNIPFKNINYTYLYLNNNYYIAIQVHIYYEDLIEEIIDKTNNIPFKYDLYISTTSLMKKEIIEKNVKNYSKCRFYEIKIFENKGRDILPFLIQMKNKVKKYKYICHIHTKKSQHNVILGENWRNYLYQNLLGNKRIISEIISDFENNEKIGFIFPDAFYEIIKSIDNYDNIIHYNSNKKDMNFILNKIFPGFEINNKINFPFGNMFWARVNAIHQIFYLRFYKIFPYELNQLNDTIMHAIERIWLYLVKLNGYFYKLIFKYY